MTKCWQCGRRLLVHSKQERRECDAKPIMEQVDLKEKVSR